MVQPLFLKLGLTNHILATFLILLAQCLQPPFTPAQYKHTLRNVGFQPSHILSGYDFAIRRYFSVL